MSDPDNNESNRDAVTFSEFEIEKISKLYQTALDLTSANEQGFLTGFKSRIFRIRPHQQKTPSLA